MTDDTILIYWDDPHGRHWGRLIETVDDGAIVRHRGVTRRLHAAQIAGRIVLRSVA